MGRSSNRKYEPGHRGRANQSPGVSVAKVPLNSAQVSWSTHMHMLLAWGPEHRPSLAARMLMGSRNRREVRMGRCIVGNGGAMEFGGDVL